MRTESVSELGRILYGNIISGYALSANHYIIVASRVVAVDTSVCIYIITAVFSR